MVDDYLFQHTATRRWLRMEKKIKRRGNRVSTHSHPKVAASAGITTGFELEFQHTATRRWLPPAQGRECRRKRFQHTATRRWLQTRWATAWVSTTFQHTATRRWLRKPFFPPTAYSRFQHTATRRWLPQDQAAVVFVDAVSTHSHPKVAAPHGYQAAAALAVSTHSHPKVAAPIALPLSIPAWGFNTQPPEGGCISGSLIYCLAACFNTQPPEGGCAGARRAAVGTRGFNTQPPEGGCGVRSTASPDSTRFQHTATRRWLPGKH